MDEKDVEMIADLMNSAVALAVIELTKNKNRIAIVNASNRGPVGRSSVRGRMLDKLQKPALGQPCRTAAARSCATRNG